jgi:hypothetical protein
MTATKSKPSKDKKPAGKGRKPKAKAKAKVQTGTQIVPFKSTRLSKPDAENQIKGILDNMNQKCREAFDKIMDKVARRVRDGLKAIWELGYDVKQVHDKEPVYGANAVARMAACVRQDKSLLYFALRFHIRYEEDRLEKLLKLRMKNGDPITATHIKYLLMVDDEKLHEKLLHRAIDEDLNPEELREEIEKVEGPTNRVGIGGRRISIPKTADGVVSNIVKQSYFWERNREKIWSDVVNRFETMPADKITPETIQKLDESIEYMDKIHEHSQLMRDALSEAKKVAVDRFEKQSKADAADDASHVGNGKKK